MSLKVPGESGSVVIHRDQLTPGGVEDPRRGPGAVSTEDGVHLLDDTDELVAPRPLPMPDLSTTSSPGSPLEGTRGSGRPVRRETVPSPGRIDRAVRSDPAAYRRAHGTDCAARRPAIADAQPFTPAPGQSWDALVRQVYGDRLGPNVSDETVALLGEVVAQLNGRSNFEAPPSTVAMPSLDDLNRFVLGLRRDLANRAPGPIIRPAVSRFAGENPTITPRPVQGSAYEARWNDTLRGVVLEAYGTQLTGLPPEEADRRLQCVMLAVAVANRLNTTDLMDAGIIWIPRPDQIERTLSYLERHPERLARLQATHAALWDSIQRTGVGANHDLQHNQSRRISLATATDDLSRRLTDAQVELRAALASQAFVDYPPSNLPLATFALALGQEGPPPAEQTPIRRPDEDFDVYLDRVAPALPPELYRRVFEHPPLLIMLSTGIMNRNGDIDPARVQEFEGTMRRLGLAREDGTWEIQAEPSETFEQAVNRVTLEAFRRLGVTVNPDDTVESVAARVSSESRKDGSENAQLVQHLTIWNQLLILGNEQTEGNLSGGSTVYSGNIQTYFDGASYGFTYGYGTKQHTCDLVVDNAFEAAPAPLVKNDYEEAEEEVEEGQREGAAVLSRERVRSGTAEFESYAQVSAQRRSAQQHEQVLERDREYGRKAVEQVSHQGEDVNRVLRDGKNPGGPGRSRLS